MDEEYEIYYNGYYFVVSGIYKKGDKPVYYYSGGGGYPGSPNEFLINKVMVYDEDDNLVEVDQETLKNEFDTNYSELEEEVLNVIENNDFYDI